MRILIVLSCLLFSFDLAAQDRPVVLAEGEGLAGTFSQKRYLAGFDRAIESNGTYSFDREIGLFWKTLTPFATTLVINETGMMQSVDGQETMKISLDQFPALKTLHDVLSLSMLGRWDVLEEKFGTKLVPDADGWTLSFDAPADAPFKSVFLKGGLYLDRLEIIKPQEDKDEITFADQTVFQVKE
ncbi:outer membrane lipoprotein carrier protein LolA [Terasakiella sp. A23]|uniref:LolA family protein n=1 Tax=Terasakiella sp. FCG-A23 TaxID=3080561 RepID=UPI0029531917|nr:outer membrane lipoprotein carrier protein LolA [Terasakiella sp. A23]MDV7341029.1 outer membrane lipoprotein carrier protein LolA [Terasakiella sp. A23]